ncbi:MAG: hypothetical protein EAZ95_14545 [Bacteroidetes bacterium]|nr:MAG: hypothetical protein EAZ95_14545 [Bacteroidota bacterium]
MKNNNKFLRILFWFIFLGIFIFMWMIDTFFISNPKSYDAFSVAKITELYRSVGRTSSYSLVYEFQIDGKIYTNNLRCGAEGAKQIGRSLLIAYSKKEPTVCFAITSQPTFEKFKKHINTANIDTIKNYEKYFYPW